MRNVKQQRSLKFRPKTRERVCRNAILPVVSNMKESAQPESSGFDPEVTEWVSRVHDNSGSINEATIHAVNSWMLAIKSSNGLREKLKRVNLFAGNDLFSALVPIIKDHGNSIDQNNGFALSDYSPSGKEAGLKDRGVVSGTYKHLDTGLVLGSAGLTNINGHLAINTMGAYERTSWVPFLGAAGREGFSGTSSTRMGQMVSGLKSRRSTFGWADNSASAYHTNTKYYNPAMGFYLGNAKTNRISLWYNGVELGYNETISTSSHLPSGSVYLFRVNNSDNMLNRAFRKSVNYYSIGSSLTDDEVNVLTSALNALNKTLGREYYAAETSEAWEWANIKTVEKIGDPYLYMDQAVVAAADEFIKKIDPIKSKLTRLNLFLAKDSSYYAYQAALVPIISKVGGRYDASYNFVADNYEKEGLKGDGFSKYLELNINPSEDLLQNNLHFSVKTETVASKLDTTLMGCSGSSAGHSAYLNVGAEVVSANLGMGGEGRSLLSSAESKGLMTISVLNQNSSSLYVGGTKKAEKVSKNSGLLPDVSRLSLFARYDQSLNKRIKHSDQRISFYSLGKGLTASEVLSLSKALETNDDNKTVFSAQNEEVWDWANVRVPSNGGILRRRDVDAVDAWVTEIKNTAGLWEKLDRANLFAGQDLAAKTVPIINSMGHKVDKIYNFNSFSAASHLGLKGSLGGHLDTGAKISDIITDESGHFSIKNYANFDSIGSRTFAHGVEGGGSKPRYSIDFNSDSVSAYVWGHDALNYSTSVGGIESVMYSPMSLPYLTSDFAISSTASQAWVTDEVFSYTAENSGMHKINFEGFITKGKWGLIWRVLKNDEVILTGDHSTGASGPETVANDGTPCSELLGSNVNLPALHCPRDYGIVIPDLSAGDKIEIQWAGGVAGGSTGDNTSGGGMSTGNQPAVGLYNSPWWVKQSPYDSDQEIHIREFKIYSVQGGDSSVKGLWTANRTTSNSAALYLDKVAKATSSNAVDPEIVTSNDMIHIMTKYPDFHLNSHDNSARMGYYTMGAGLSPDEVAAVSDALSNLDLKLKRNIDEEVYDWAYTRVPKNGGTLTEDSINCVNDWMNTIKAEGIRPFIKRFNPFVGDDTTQSDIGKVFALKAAMVPLITEELGHDVDKSFGFTYKDFIQGIYSDGSTDKFIDTGLKPSSMPGIDADLSYVVNFLEPPISVNRNIVLGDGVLNLSFKTDDISFGSSETCLAHDDNPIVNSSVGWSSKAYLYPYGITAAGALTSGGQVMLSFVKDHQGTEIQDGARAATYAGPICNPGLSDHPITIFGKTKPDGGGLGQYEGRIASYLVGVGSLDATKNTKLAAALGTLNKSLRRGRFISNDNEVWDWAHDKVLDLNNGKLSSRVVDSVDKFMTSIKAAGIRNDIKRMNLFCGLDLKAALVPLIADSGPNVDYVANFVESDYSPMGSGAGLTNTGVGGKYLNTLTPISSLLGDGDHHMAIKLIGSHSDDLETSIGPNLIAGGGDQFGVKFRGFGSRYRDTSFFIGNDTYQSVETFRPTLNCQYDATKYYACNIPSLITNVIPPPNQTLAFYLNNLYSCRGYNYINPADVNMIISQGSIDGLVSDWLQRTGRGLGASDTVFDFINRTDWKNQGLNVFYNANYKNRFCSTSMSSILQNSMNGIISLSLGTDDITKGGGLYSLSTTNGGKTANLHHDGGLKLRYTLSELTAASGENLSLFGFSMNNIVSAYTKQITMSFYSAGNTGSFKPDIMNDALGTLDKDLGRNQHVVAGAVGAFDEEVNEWANEKVPNNGGMLTGSQVEAVNEFMLSIKSVSGLRNKISRCNLFIGQNIDAALVPLISDAGGPIDLSHGFTNSDFSVGGPGSFPGISSGSPETNDGNWSALQATKWIDTALFPDSKSKLVDNAGHIMMSLPDISKVLSTGTSIPLSIIPATSDTGTKGTTRVMITDNGISTSIFGNISTTSTDAASTSFDSTETRNAVAGGLIAITKSPTTGASSIYVQNPSVEGANISMNERASKEVPALVAQKSSLKLFAWAYGNSNYIKKGYLGTMSFYCVGDFLSVEEASVINDAFKALQVKLAKANYSVSGNVMSPINWFY